MRHQDDLSVDFALGEISEEEFLVGATPEQVTEAQEFTRATARLGESVKPLDPPAYLRSQLMARIQDTEQQPFVAAPLDPRFGDSPARTKARRRWFSPARLVATGAAAAALAALGWGIVQTQQLHKAQETISALEASASASASPGSLLNQISQATDMSFAQGSMGSSTFSVVYSPSHGMASISAANLPPLPQGKGYMIWFYDADGNLVGSGTLNHSGTTSLTEMTTAELATVTDFGITVEDTGSTSPSQKPVMLEPMNS